MFSGLVLVAASMPVPSPWASCYRADRIVLLSVLPCSFRKQRMIFLCHGLVFLSLFFSVHVAHDQSSAF